ncbi:hypothetical protein AB0I69_33390 [Streptomyces sp. NPDC050508]|uniref:hypothetical protein n=1 Tax=Streptomyces sp. NPDC050508 TaxID=3155405 RepID=UPI003418261A
MISSDGVLPLELGIAAQIFSMDPDYELTVATYGQVVPVARSGFSATGAAGLDALEKADTVIVPEYAEVPSVAPGRAAHG